MSVLIFDPPGTRPWLLDRGVGLTPDMADDWGAIANGAPAVTEYPIGYAIGVAIGEAYATELAANPAALFWSAEEWVAFLFRGERPEVHVSVTRTPTGTVIARA